MGILNERIKKRRLEVGLTLLQVAESLGIEESTVQRYESGKIENIKYETMIMLSNILKCSPTYLMGWSDDVNPEKEKLSKGRELTDIELKIIELVNLIPKERHDDFLALIESALKLQELL